MDSGSSGSMQSSSTGGGDEEYDSRAAADSLSAFFNTNNPTSHVGPMPNPSSQPPLPSSSSTSTSSMFDPLFTNYFDPSLTRSSPQLNSNTNSLLNLDMIWSKNIRSDPNCSDFGNLMGSSQTFRPSFQGTNTQTVQESVQRASHDQNINTSNTNNSSSSNLTGTRNPKKRSRASRRAPTTVLQTDTGNFRAMVQEFTGIPAPPFTSSPFQRSRLDLFGTTASALRSVGTSHLDVSQSAGGPYNLLRPFAQKVQPPPFVAAAASSSSLSSSSLFASPMVDAITSTTTTGTASNNTTTSSLRYQLPSDIGSFLKQQQQPQNLLNMNMQNSVLNFQSFLQGPPRYPLSNTAILGSKQPQGTSIGIQSTSDHSQLKMGAFEDQFGSSHGQVNTHTHTHDNLGGLQNIVSSEGWAADGDRSLLRSINGNYGNSTTQGGNNGKLNYGGSSSSDIGVHGGDKGTENVASRSEGMVDSWICSSD